MLKFLTHSPTQRRRNGKQLTCHHAFYIKQQQHPNEIASNNNCNKCLGSKLIVMTLLMANTHTTTNSIILSTEGKNKTTQQPPTNIKK